MSRHDNFARTYGYSKRFGLGHVDHATQRRTPKDSHHGYRIFIVGSRQSAVGSRQSARGTRTPPAARSPGPARALYAPAVTPRPP
ncbi:family 1 glycosylhydrolase [Streptomyces fradiae]|uniref:family 1 glycosylhydrolase n=1 Tax=Streptomyces fradiae TaxID=1906 RepID=UPI00201A0B2E|nr:family 1 glycosylhydrolase [Streptomyces fradiae]UQS29332.1 family 1 glycosylhydrolase [Streptomyces fradiae]